MTYAVENLGLGLGQAQKYGRVKPVKEIQTLPILIELWLLSSH